MNYYDETMDHFSRIKINLERLPNFTKCMCPTIKVKVKRDQVNDMM
jgi:hypothetical protein